MQELRFCEILRKKATFEHARVFLASLGLNLLVINDNANLQVLKGVTPVVDLLLPVDDLGK